MRQPSSRGRILPKISTMPRQKSEAAAYLDIYKLVIEKKRLQQELHTMEQRRKQIEQRLGVLQYQISAIENTIPMLAENLPVPTEYNEPISNSSSQTIDTLFLEY